MINSLYVGIRNEGDAVQSGAMLRGFGFVTLVACAAPGGVRTSATTIVGHFGGVHAGLVLTDSGGTISYDCAHGAIAEPLRPDENGRFVALGTHTREHGGPVRIDEIPDSVPARYVGQVIGDRLSLRVTTQRDTLGPYELRRGASPQLFRCL